MKERILILCIDRDNDIGEKTKHNGPIIGRDKNLKVATDLALADPTDSDANTIFEAIRIYDELKKEKKPEVVTLTGDKEVGIKSDEIISKQLDKLMKKTKIKKAILVTDGLEDEHLIPILHGKLDIISVRRVIMKQSERLEGMYYMIHDFIENPKMSKIFLGVPALALLLYALFGSTGWRIILGLIGVYLLIKGFKFEEPIQRVLEEMQTSLTKRKASFFFYTAAILVFFVGFKTGYDFMYTIAAVDMLEKISAFIKGSVYIFFLASLIATSGKIISVESKKQIFKYITFIALSFSLSFVASETASIVLVPELGLFRLFVAIAFGFLIVLASILLERKIE